MLLKKTSLCYPNYGSLQTYDDTDLQDAKSKHSLTI